jgi:hypothetical protein
MDEKVRKSIFHLFDEKSGVFNSLLNHVEFKNDQITTKKEQLESFKICTDFFLENVEQLSASNEVERKLFNIFEKMLKPENWLETI